MIYVNEKDLVVPGELLAEDDYYSGRGTFEEDGKVCSKLLGLVSLRNKKISVIPLKSKYLPKKGDVVIGKIDDVRFSMWGVDINSPYSGILPASEVFGREKKELSRVFDIGDVLFLRIVDVDEVKKVKLGLKGRGMGKFKGGVIVDIAPTKVPRLIGKKGSMINMIKDKTGCKIVVGQNGLVWVKGNEDMEQIVKNIIKLIEKEAHTSGLTDRIKNKLCLLIDGELPPEEEEEAEPEVEEDAFEEGLKKPELQDFREEVEKELAEENFDDDSDEDFDDEDSEEEDIEDYEDDSGDIEEDFEDFDDDSDEEFDDEGSEEGIEELEEDITDDELEDVISEAISEDEDSAEDDLVEEENEDLEDSEEESVDDSEGEEESSEEEPVEEAAKEPVEDSEGEEESSEEDSEDDEDKEEKSKKPKFLDTFEYIHEQKKKNKSSFDFSRADNSKSPTLNISQGRGI